ncbi:galactose-1-phosphate guanylyltransferase [Artemisia annua]|uniref:Galactose-1-phosphate guanylyltransferase n=1 Tax=Artemisia annua TaxID=35608 RepID=A0A2U1LP07_ARTAN|nr:galactose-1-phosphate guanylyltransferase [Artemisia annua]
MEEHIKLERTTQRFLTVNDELPSQKTVSTQDIHTKQIVPATAIPDGSAILDIGPDSVSITGPSFCFLDSLLLEEWEGHVERGLFRYDVTACETKVIPGDYGFVAQLDKGRYLIL